MKKQSAMNKLTFNKVGVTELNDTALIEINGGSTIIGGETCTGCCCGPLTTKISIVRTIEVAEI